MNTVEKLNQASQELLGAREQRRQMEEGLAQLEKREQQLIGRVSVLREMLDEDNAQNELAQDSRPIGPAAENPRGSDASSPTESID